MFKGIAAVVLLALMLAIPAAATHRGDHGTDVGGLEVSQFKEAITATTEFFPVIATTAMNQRYYITGIVASNQAATVQTLDIVYGTGTNCGTGTTAVSHKIQFGTNATTTSPFIASAAFPTPIRIPANQAVCVRPSAATAFGATITGYVGQ